MLIPNHAHLSILNIEMKTFLFSEFYNKYGNPDEPIIFYRCTSFPNISSRNFINAASNYECLIIFRTLLAILKEIKITLLH